MSARSALKAVAKPAVLRCAIYTRKSSEEGLEQAFNSLHAQRQSCEAYILSQAGEGWSAVATEYDDGGISGGTMERPGLKALLEDVRQGLIDVVVVYKVDRLTRSLADFAKIVDIFDANGVSFVSVTQAFNTTSSMGRLTLNVLLSFAQFEREVTGERIRDKIALSKAKGMWMGGTLSLGYDRSGRTLVVNAPEAEIVRLIFRRYLQLGSVHLLRDELERQGIRSKRYVSAKGREIGGAVIGRGGLFHILQNRLYLGEIVHKDQVHPGLHPAIVDRSLFDRVQRRLEQNRITRRSKPTRTSASALTGRIFDGEGEPMTPTFSYGRGGRAYRYYVSTSLQQGKSPDPRPGLIRRVGADALERFLALQLQRIADRPSLIAADLPTFIRRLDLRPGDTQMVLEADALFGDDHPELAFEDLQGRLRPGERVVKERGARPAIRIALPIRMQLRGGRTWIDNAAAPPQPRLEINAAIVSALKHAHAELLALDASPLTPLEQLAFAKAPDDPRGRQRRGLAFLAPELQRMLLEGSQPERLTITDLLTAEIPLAWEDQRVWISQLLRLAESAPAG